jgi:starvation-inducible outer membrane lipoprotein
MKRTKNNMKNFLIVLLPFTLFSCNTSNDSIESNSSEVDTTQSNLIMINDTLRVVHDTVMVIGEEGQVEYFYSYDNYEDIK